ncbi:hypothetical protein DH2020_011017 [Rehmannia glutinosa]|uniref:Terpene synthase N-terminal domain-containing protein n=1 Tax=Rehmannia glutinosa TaxID=99300 RepID=A0ABR0XC67_REHGL
MNNNGYFNISLGDDIKGMLQLYEASFLLTQGENVLELAREFASKILQEKIEDEGNNGNFDDEYLSLLVRQALELPLHWRIQRINATWFINAYERRPDMNPLLLELAKLDFNIVQATHQQELKHVSSWWKETCLAEKLPFARDWVVECYFWNFGAHIEPQYRYSRIMATKVSALITIIDDMFDVYGTFQELQLFNNAIQGWDIEAMDKLPDYMQMCFLGLNNFIDEMAYHWADYCRALLQEAEWCSRGYTPKLEEYINNAWMSISFRVILTHAFFSMTNPIEEETVQSLYKYHNIIRYSSTIIRLANDLSTSEDEMKKGDVPKSIQCYMNETGASREEAREHIKFLMYEMWKKLNEERVADSPFQSEFVKATVDHVRMGLAVSMRVQGIALEVTETSTSLYSSDPRPDKICMTGSELGVVVTMVSLRCQQ